MARWAKEIIRLHHISAQRVFQINCLLLLLFSPAAKAKGRKRRAYKNLYGRIPMGKREGRGARKKPRGLARNQDDDDDLASLCLTSMKKKVHRNGSVKAENAPVFAKDQAQKMLSLGAHSEAD